MSAIPSPERGDYGIQIAEFGLSSKSAFSRSRRQESFGGVQNCIVIARGAKRAAAIQLDCFVVPLGGTPRNDKFGHHQSFSFSYAFSFSGHSAARELIERENENDKENENEFALN